MYSDGYSFILALSQNSCEVCYSMYHSGWLLLNCFLSFSRICCRTSCRPKYSEIYQGYWITIGPNISHNRLVTRFPYSGIFHRYFLATKFHGESVLKYFHVWPENGTPFDHSDQLPGFWAILYIVLMKTSTVQTCCWRHFRLCGCISFRSCCCNCNTNFWLVTLSTPLSPSWFCS